MSNKEKNLNQEVSEKKTSTENIEEVKVKTFTEDEVNKLVNEKVDYIRQELIKRNEAEAFVRQKEFNEKLNKLNQEVYGEKAKKIFASLNGDLKKWEDFAKVSEVDITKDPEELKQEMIDVLDKKNYFRITGVPIAPIDEKIQKALKPKPSPVEEALKEFGFDNKFE